MDGRLVGVHLNFLELVAKGKVPIEPEWFGERINFSPESGAFIEFREGPEKVPGFPASRAVEVSEDYVKRAYAVSDDHLMLVKSVAEKKFEQVVGYRR